ncbi:hypothetical protein L226DRAFT_572475 [Lentinus tigrinus ALCF2SS1-7]|uniref:Uncharacterized protein n=1 Tax=Lentinus tigrinus ALCF2SS1-6 TaxID=1328759 RepID=A0A5C2S5K6_9APHY|nr:hypothetical protein L227DRAFT_612299 [Lentinus tigrinus ALCF2SS1-6]RPD73422.1 hypothetical protein L226DRAFT_572475 [Lentinus tigrinus ALCF2SS1-7]
MFHFSGVRSLSEVVIPRPEDHTTPLWHADYHPEDNGTQSGSWVVTAYDDARGFVVTSPNVMYIPEIISGRVSVFLHADGTYGSVDPVSWPQVFAPQLPYLAAISKQTRSPHPQAPVWTLPLPGHFVPVTGVPARNFGLLHDDIVYPLEAVARQLRSEVQDYILSHPSARDSPLVEHELIVQQASVRLRHMVATFRDHVVEVATLRRHWQLAKAYMRYFDLATAHRTQLSSATDCSLMGAWSTHPGEVDHLRRLGIPVWFVDTSLPARHHGPSSCPQVKFTRALGLCTSILADSPLYQGIVGPGHLSSTLRFWTTFQEISRVPGTQLVSQNNRSGGSTVAIQPRGNAVPLSDVSDGATLTLAPVHPSHKRGRDKFVDFDHAWMPCPLPCWCRALAQVDRSAVARRPELVWPYWIPEPALILGPQDAVRARRYVMNWVRARPIWLWLLRRGDQAAVTVTTQMWRSYLNGVPEPSLATKSGRRAMEIKQIFGAVLAQEEVEPHDAGGVQWHQYHLSDVPEDLCPIIIWEVHELAFRYELLALDRACRPARTPAEDLRREDLLARVFPSQALWSVISLPPPDSVGLFARVPHRRIAALNALREVLIGWPGCPDALLQETPLTGTDTADRIEVVESRIARFYVNSFFHHAGRAPIVPHMLPSWR